jgi:glycosyltransferase involved in cell wall biosynthesis
MNSRSRGLDVHDSDGMGPRSEDPSFATDQATAVMLPRLALTSNVPQAKYLFAELRKLSTVVADLDFDNIDPITKYAAAVLAFKRPRSEWYGNYQMHPLIQRRRRRVLQRGLRHAGVQADALLMWGSWFHPFKGYGEPAMPFFNYIDQSRSLTPVLGEPTTSTWGRNRSHQLQADTYRASSGICCMSKWAHDQTLMSHAIDPGKVMVVGWGPCAVDLSGEAINMKQREKLVLHVSNDFRRKGVDFLLETAARVARAEPTVRFVVIGRDSSRLPVTNTEHVSFLGPIWDRELLATHFRRASVFFLPHRFDRSPHVLAEALSGGLPIVTSAQGGPMELVEGQGTGFCEPVGDIDGYSRSILRILADLPLAEEMSQRARALMLRRYNWPAVARAILDCISRKLRQKDP